MLKSITQQEYLKLIQECYDAPEYEDQVNDIKSDLLESYNRLSVEEKEKLSLFEARRSSNKDLIDVTNYTKPEIEKILFQYNSFQINHFRVKILKYYDNPDTNKNCAIDCSIWRQDKLMVYRVDVPNHKDFAGCPLLHYFKKYNSNSYNLAERITPHDLINFMKYLQIISKFKAFI